MRLTNFPDSRLRQNYLLYFEIALIISLSTFIVLFKLQLPERSINDTALTISEQEILHLEGIVTTKHTEEKPAPPPDVYVPNPPPKNEIVEEQLQNLDIEFSLPAPIPLPTVTKNRENVAEKRNIYPLKDMPQLIGGMAKLQRNIFYPRTAVEDQIEGRVVIEFIVDKKGRVRDPKIIKGVRNDINREAIRAISKARFLPARKKGKPIPVQQVIYILFKLNNEL